MAEITFKLNGPDLASRETAAIERHRLLSQIATGSKAVVDLSGVESVSYSYADELFGVLAATKGLDWFIKNVSLVNTNEHVLRVIAEIVNRRLKEAGLPIAKTA